MSSPIAINLLTALIVIVNINICTAHWDGAYMRNPTDGFTMKTNWLSGIRDDVKLRDIAFPGTEKSAAFDIDQRDWIPTDSEDSALKKLIDMGINSIINDALTTQALSIKKQLNYGIRVLDIQLCHIRDVLILTCGYTHLNIGLEGILMFVINFLIENPTETVLINLYESKRIPSFGNSLNLEQVLNSSLSHGGLRMFYLKTDNLDITLGEARGKFILMSRETKFGSTCLKLNTDKLKPSIVVNSVIMDKTYLSTNWDLYWEKWIPAKQHILTNINNDDNKILINYINGWGGSFPYFVASGHSSSGTSAPRLLTGATTPGFYWKYPDFPRLSCWGELCSIAFEGVNVLTRDLIRNINKQQHKRTVGIILIDFPGEDLINVIISNNNRLKKF